MNATFAKSLKKIAVGALPGQAGICANSSKYNSLVGSRLKILHILVKLCLPQFSYSKAASASSSLR